MARFKVKHGNHSDDNGDHEQGDIIDAPDDFADKHGAKFEKVGDGTPTTHPIKPKKSVDESK